MNPFPAARWTEEDADIWVRLLKRWGLYRYAVALHWSQGQDKRDAELMYEMQRYRSFGYIGPLPAMAKLPHDPYPYAGGVRLGRKREWEEEVAADPAVDDEGGISHKG
jgi:hypothetical protein